MQKGILIKSELLSPPSSEERKEVDVFKQPAFILLFVL